MKRIFSLLWIGIITLLSISYTFAYTQEQREAYEWAYKYGITTQPTVEAAKLDWKLTRQAFSKMIVNYLENAVWIRKSVPDSCYIPDESQIISNLRPYVKKTCAYGIMWQSGANFRPMNSLTRAHLWTVLSRMVWWDEYNSTWKWYYIYHLNALKYSGIMNRIDNPQEYTKRWDVLVMLKRIYEKFGSNIDMNGVKSSAYSSQIINLIGSREESNNEYISDVYNNSNIIYTWKDWTKYYYDDKFLGMLQSVAEKQWESSLSDYLKIETEYFKNWLDQISELNDEDLLKAIWIDVDTIDTNSMTKQEKQNLINKFRTALNRIIADNKAKNTKLIKDLETITKNISNDKFGLKEKLKETKSFMKASNAFLDQYGQSISKLMELALLEEDENSEAWMAQVFWLMWIAVTYQWEAEKYQQYVEKWWANTVKLLWLN